MNSPVKQVSVEKAPNLVDLIRSANQGNAEALSLLKRELAGDNAKKLIHLAGDLAHSLEQSTLDAMLGDNQSGTRLVVLEKMNQMRAELGWNASPMLERILIERVCQTWLNLHLLEMADAQSKSRPISLAKYESERIERAERRHLKAVKMLATVRKMALPLQIELKGELTVTESASASPRLRNRFDLEHSKN
ncbi:MAG: hypothetical protein ACK5PB_23105 [Pirellula sp.]